MKDVRSRASVRSDLAESTRPVPVPPLRLELIAADLADAVEKLGLARGQAAA